MRSRLHLVSLCVLGLFMAACAGKASLPVGPTPIPTLVPATQPAGLPGSAATPVFALLSYPARLPSAALGQTIYDSHCASCHGSDGKGTMPGARNFNDLDFMRGESPASFYSDVTEGRGEMPSFRDTLSSDDRWDVVFYLWRFSTSTDTLALGKNIYAGNCVACHGANGVGAVLGAADFTDQHSMDDRAPRDFYLVVTQGEGSMPAWQGRLSQDERWAVIDYIRTFTYDPALPGDLSQTPEIEASATPEIETSATESTCTTTYVSNPNPFAWDDATTIASGKVIYEQNCIICHGPDGSGTLPGAPDFTAKDVQDELHSQNGDFACIVAEGQGAMPGWKETLKPEQIWQVLTYIGSLAGK